MEARSKCAHARSSSPPAQTGPDDRPPTMAATSQQPTGPGSPLRKAAGCRCTASVEARAPALSFARTARTLRLVHALVRVVLLCQRLYLNLAGRMRCAVPIGVLRGDQAQQSAEKARRGQRPPPPPARGVWEDVLEEVVDVPDRDAHQVNGGRVAKENRECEQHPGQVGRSELEESEKGHADVLVPPAPYVHHHKCERGAQEGRDVYEGGAGAQESTAKEDHVEKVSGAAAEAAVLQKAAVSYEEEHVEEEIEADGAEEEEVGEDSPNLELEEDQLHVEVEGEWGNNVERARSGREDRRGEVHPGDERHLEVPLIKACHQR
mmetsp:Transcript_4743/g.15556  ORF Transcript_4743/g.15556 Transcript_4743/m.15556 type:complete len:321 (-) Transcript_4743:88-1050(-)